jgi:hypothetical protein
MDWESLRELFQKAKTYGCNFNDDECKKLNSYMGVKKKNVGIKSASNMT